MFKKMAECAGAAVLFAICGAASSHLYADRGIAPNFIGVPFALLCAVLVARGHSPVLVAFAVSVVWPIAQMVAVGIDLTTEIERLPMAAAGLTGGLGVAGGVGIACRRLRSPFWLAGAALVGCIAALAFEPRLASHDSHLNTHQDILQPIRLRYAFAIWQCAVGTYAFAVSRD